VEPPGADVPARRPHPLIGLDIPTARLAALAGAAVVAVASRGDALLLGVALGVGAGSVVAGTASVLAGIAVLVRWGSASLAALAGAQAVLGPAGTTGSVPAAASAWCAASAFVLVVRPLAPDPEGPRWLRVGLVLAATVPFGVAAADVVAGPGPGGSLATRVVASAVATVLGAVIVVRVHRSTAGRLRWAGVALGFVAVALAVVG
jgi:hypothetical protein